MLGTIHNLAYYQTLMQELRSAIEVGGLEAYVAKFYAARGLEVPELKA
jgi:queuine tRNA-ribosyltransferase